jgi:hypothetical protein
MKMPEVLEMKFRAMLKRRNAQGFSPAQKTVDELRTRHKFSSSKMGSPQS